MNKDEFLQLMGFPKEWLLLEMYPDELFKWQLNGYLPGHEKGAEHDRNGAFHWWLRRLPTRDQLENLLRLAALDPDRGLGDDIRTHLRKEKHFDSELSALEAQLFGC
jgi:hypothetical protein